MSVRSPNRWTLGWITLCLVLAAHVVDEALNDFLALYNPVVAGLSERFPWSPFRTFTFEGWLSGLVIVVVVLLALSILVSKGSRWMRPASYVFSAAMLANGVGHTVASFVRGELIAGVYTAPVLIAASIFLLVSVPARGAARPGGSGDD